tara:strand:- start:343 stop:531 length:189 start_codon:yes stop_codon:yes gene_type:complete
VTTAAVKPAAAAQAAVARVVVEQVAAKLVAALSAVAEMASEVREAGALGAADWVETAMEEVG